MNKTVLQIPVDSSLRIRADKKALEMGFSSLQETIRVFLVQLAEGAYQVTIAPKPVQLSKKAIARYNKLIDNPDELKLKK